MLACRASLWLLGRGSRCCDAGAAPARCSAPARRRAQLTAACDALVRVYDAILDARFDQVEAELQRACGAGAARGLRRPRGDRHLVAHPARSGQPRARRAVHRPRSSARSARPKRGPRASPKSAEAWFYLGGAYAARVQWRVLRDEKLAAARDGKRIKQALERALALDPDLDDALLRDRAVPVLRRRRAGRGEDPALPADAARRRQDRRAGADAARARAGHAAAGRSRLPAPHRVSLVREARRPRALELLRVLHDRYPGNPLFPAQIADIQDLYQHDITASLDTWRALLARGARRPRQRGRARRGAGAARHRAPARGAAADRPGHRAPARDPRRASRRARSGASRPPTCARRSATTGSGITTPPSPPTGCAISTAPLPRSARRSAAAPPIGSRRTPDARSRRSVSPLARRTARARAGGRSPAPSRCSRAALALDPHDPVARYRYGRVLQANKDDDRALRSTRSRVAIRDARDVPAADRSPPRTSKPARLHERAGRTDEAIALLSRGAARSSAAAPRRAAPRTARSRAFAHRAIAAARRPCAIRVAEIVTSRTPIAFARRTRDALQLRTTRTETVFRDAIF